MVAAHGGDLRAAGACGLQTAFVPRPREHPGAETEAEADRSYDDLIALAEDLVDRAPESG